MENIAHGPGGIVDGWLPTLRGQGCYKSGKSGKSGKSQGKQTAVREDLEMSGKLDQHRKMSGKSRKNVFLIYGK